MNDAAAHLIDRLQIPLATFDDGRAAFWDTATPGSPHCVITGPTGSGKTVLQRSIAGYLCDQQVGTLSIRQRHEEHLRADTSLVWGARGFGYDIDGLQRAAHALHDIANYVTSNRASTPPHVVAGARLPLVVLIDDAHTLFGSWAYYCGASGIAAPHTSLRRILAERRPRPDVIVCVSVQRDFGLSEVTTTGTALHNTFGTRCAVGPQTTTVAQLLWGTRAAAQAAMAVGRTEVGRAVIASGPDATPTRATITRPTTVAP